MSSLPPLAQSGNPFHHIWHDLGYTRLCPIIPPGAPVSEKSSIARLLARGKDPRGKAPGVVGHDGQWRGFDWLKTDSTAEAVARWAEMGSDDFRAGVGMLMGRGLVAVDIDTRDIAAAKRVHALAVEMLGEAPLRFGARPKALLLYACDDAVPYGQVRFLTETETDPKKPALVEILTEGRQFVAHGVHPVTGKPYVWTTPLPPRAELPRVTAVGVAAFIERVRETTGGEVTGGAVSTDRAGVDQDALRGDVALLDEAINHYLPNDPDIFPSRNDYVNMGIAIKAAYGPEHDAEGLDAYAQWCGRWPVDDTLPEDEWSRMHPPFKLGANYVYDMAMLHGGWPPERRARQFFAPIAPAELDAADLLPKAKPLRVIEILSLDDIERMPDPTWLVDRHIPEQGFGLLYGDPSCGKSFLALDLALHLAYGLPDWHGDGLPAGGAHVLYLAGEGASGFKARAAAWRQGRLLPSRRPRFSLIRQPLNFLRKDDMDALLQVVGGYARESAWGAPGLVIVDTVSRSIPGADENLQKDMTVFVDAVGRLQDAFECAALGVHHTSKAGSLRGSSVFSGQADFVLRLERAKGSSVGQLTCEKQKDGPDGWRDTYRLVEVTTEHGKSLVPGRVDVRPEDDDGAPAATEGAEIGEARQIAILEAMRVAWDMGIPWSRRRAKGRRAAREIMSEIFGVGKEDAEALMDRWLVEGRVGFDTYDARRRIEGYRPVEGWTPDADVGGFMD